MEIGNALKVLQIEEVIGPRSCLSGEIQHVIYLYSVSFQSISALLTFLGHAMPRHFLLPRVTPCFAKTTGYKALFAWHRFDHCQRYMEASAKKQGPKPPCSLFCTFQKSFGANLNTTRRDISNWGGAVYQLASGLGFVGWIGRGPYVTGQSEKC